MSCEKIENNWHWKNGKSSSMTIGGVTIPMNYFTCGVYYFDGIFQVVKFPKGMQLYHGSKPLADANVEYPNGLTFYETYDFSQKRQPPLRFNEDELVSKEITEIISEQLNPNPAWYGDEEVASLYSSQSSKQTKKLIFSYELKKDAVFIILDNDFNLWQILNGDVPDEIKNTINRMFDFKGNFHFDSLKFGEINVVKGRTSFSDVDFKFSQWLCSFAEKEKYVGYAANNIINNDRSIFHLEFMICNSPKWLKRNLENPSDWQYNSQKPKGMLNILLSQFSLFKTTNVDFHSGNLYEHSIWSLLFAEKLVLSPLFPGMPALSKETQKFIAGIAFIHDIGKLDPENCKKTAKGFVYHTLPKHPEIGEKIITGEKKLTVFNKQLEAVGFFDIQSLLKELGYQPSDYTVIGDMIGLHWEFGFYVSQLQRLISENNTQITEQQFELAARAFITKVGNRSFMFYYGLIVISIADILASQPFTDFLPKYQNAVSRFFPGISNVPKKYRGGNVKDLTSYLREKLTATVFSTLIKQGITLDNSVKI